MNGGPYGFHNAPVTRTFVIASALLTLLVGIQGRSLTLGLSYEEIFQKLQIWRVIASLFAFSSTPELIFGLLLLYYFRVFERQIGSNKHSVFMLFSLLASSSFQVLILAFLKDPNFSRLASGPYGLIFASFIPFYFDIPVSSSFRIFGIRLTDKSFIYLAGLQLLFSSWKSSMVPGICGLLAGSLYRLNLLGIRKVKFPQSITSFFSRISWSNLQISSSTSSTANLPRTVPSYWSHQHEDARSSVLASSVEPSATYIAELVAMGFDGRSARQALVHAGNDLNVATNILLESQSH
ncbi:hypothetical protein HPP92_018368 [Vanilla planifolia]|uniref:UBA domain-containing protein n=1 Tax=Vanilla planifolia TaxID=51239 RepID=A0A835Q9N9_VANPL|nr:hypothetical protein HPP92_018980 [Vanilla planifolia]KAG0469040.1 hypothetical protein HPP92_018368 [Vanilla planifolia]